MLKSFFCRCHSIKHDFGFRLGVDSRSTGMTISHEVGWAFTFKIGPHARRVCQLTLCIGGTIVSGTAGIDRTTKL
jgi:hypothetical protein